jgi:hypothetical protein
MQFFYTVLDWIFGIIMLLMGGLCIFFLKSAEGLIAGIAFISMSSLLLPPARKLIYSRVNKIIASTVRVSSIIALIVAGIIFIAFSGDASYIHFANMTKVQSHYEEAIRIARTTYVKGFTQEDLVPENASDWIPLFNPGGSLAPGGGNAYLANDIDGDPVTGAIGVISNSRESVTIAMPAYSELSAETTIVTAASVLE